MFHLREVLEVRLRGGFIRPTIKQFFTSTDFEEISKYYTVNVTTDSNVSVDSPSKEVIFDGTVTFTLSFNGGYILDSVSHGSVDGDTWTINNVTSDMSVSVSSQAN